MECIYCSGHTKVVDKRDSSDAVRRRRECLQCGKRFTTYERAEKPEIVVVKSDGRRELFSKDKIVRSMRVACQKRPVSMDSISVIADEIESAARYQDSIEVDSKFIGKLVMERLKEIDVVAYVRFASVYQSFETITQFEQVVETLKR